MSFLQGLGHVMTSMYRFQYEKKRLFCNLKMDFTKLFPRLLGLKKMKKINEFMFCSC